MQNELGTLWFSTTEGGGGTGNEWTREDAKFFANFGSDSVADSAVNCRKQQVCQRRQRNDIGLTSYCGVVRLPLGKADLAGEKDFGGFKWTLMGAYPTQSRLHEDPTKWDRPDLGIQFSFVLVVGALVMLVGCGVNDRVMLGSVEYYENEAKTGRIVKIDAWGVHLITNEADSSLSFGRSQRIYFLRGEQSQAPEQAWSARRALLDFKSAGKCNRIEACKARAWDLANPIVMDTRNLGLELAANSNRIGICIGGRRSTSLMAPIDSDFILILNYCSEDIRRCRFSFQESASCDCEP